MAAADFSTLLKPSAPSLDRPFGVQLWPIFDKVFSSVMGYSPQDFRFREGETPMSTFRETAGLIIAYYAIILCGREFMRNRKPMRLTGLFMIHNLYLTLISGALLALFIEQLLPTIWRHGLFYSICNHRGGWTKPLVTLYYLNYLTKYLELLDTVFLFLKKKPLTFLHCYHHGATAFLCYTQLIGHTAVSWTVITLNLLVHVVMYWYYFQSARGVRVWWKEWVTKLQIVQFIIDIGFVYFTSYTYFTSTYFPHMPNAGSCAGEEFAAFAGIGIISSYLLLFISFYLATYTKTGRGDRKAAKKAAKDLKDREVPSLTEATDALSNGHVPITANGMANGSANGSATASARKAPVTRSRKA